MEPIRFRYGGWRFDYINFGKSIELIFLSFISLLLIGNPVAHEFKMSVCEINYSEATKAFEVKFYLFQDDLKEALYGNPAAPQLNPTKVDGYILNNIKVHFGDQIQALQFQSVQEKKDQILVSYTLPFPDPSAISKLHISNRLLIEKFRKQTNIVFLQIPGEEKLTLMLDAKKTEGEFVWK